MSEVDSSSFQDLLENALDPILVAVGDVPVFANAPTLALTGYDAREILSLKLGNLIHGDGLAKIRGFDRGEGPDLPPPGSFFAVLVCSDRSLRPVEITVLKTTWQGHHAAILIFRDTSQRAEEIAHLREIEQNLRFLIENVNDGILVSSDTGRHLFANRTICERLGYSMEELQNMHYTEVLHPDEIPKVSERYSNRIAGRSAPRRYEIQARAKDGTAIPVELTAAATTWRGKLADVAIVRDLTEQKRSEVRLQEERTLNERLLAEAEERRRIEEALRESEKRFRDVAEAMGEYIWEIDAAGRITFITEQVTAILGYRPEELLGRTPFEFGFPTEGGRSAQDLLTLIAASTEVLTFEQHARARDGGEVWLRVRPLTLRDEEGRVMGFRGTALDITVQKRAEEALRRRDAILEAVSYSAERLLKAQHWGEGIDAVLEHLGRAAGVERATLWESYHDRDGVHCARRRHVWTDPRFTADEKPAVQNVPITTLFPKTWVETVEQGHPVQFSAQGCSEPLGNLLQELGTRAVLTLPVLVDGHLWGMLGLSNPFSEFAWQPSEIEALRLAGSVLGAVMQRLAVEEALKRKDRILEAVGFTAERLLGSRNWEERIAEVMEHLGRASDASRVLVQEIRPGADGEHFLRWRHGWSLPEWPFPSPGGWTEELPIRSSGYGGVLEALQRGQAQILPPPEAPPEVKEIVYRFGVVSLLTIPIMVHGKLWGMLAFSDCVGGRNWSTPEMDALRAAGDILGAVMERQGFDETLRESEEKYRSLVEGTDQVIAVIDRQGIFHFANARALSYLGMEGADLVGRTMWDLFPKEDADRQVDSIVQTLESGRLRINQNPTTIRGELRWFESRLQPMLERDGQHLMLQFIGTDITERKEAEQRILSYQQKLRSLSSELALAEQRERRRIAAELHDRIGQFLAITKIKLSQLRDGNPAPPLRKSLNELWGLVDQTIQDTRSLTFELSPPILYELGLEPALDWLVERTRSRDGLSATFHDDGKKKPVGQDLAGLLFQAVQELLINVAKHAAAQKVDVTVSREGDELRCQVKDDGRGFEAAKISIGPSGGVNPAGFGLFSIRERLGQLGGRLEVDSALGRGTRAVLWAPLLVADPADPGAEDESTS